MTSPAVEPRMPEGFRRTARILAPIAVTSIVFVYLFTRIDVKAVGEALSVEIFVLWVLPLLAFSAVTVAIEAQCLHRVVPVAHATIDRWTAARIKAACYLLGILNYALGAAGLSVLLQRRARLGLADAASVVFLISLFDVGAVLVLAAAGAGFVDVDALGVRIGLVGGLIGAIIAGFFFLRAPIRMGPLDRVRQLDVFRAPRTASIPC